MVLVTGAAGFVGSHLIELLERDNDTIVAWKRPGTTPLVTGVRTRWMDVELLDRDQVGAALTDVSPTAVYHLAGVPHVGDSWAHTYETFAGNVLGTHHLLFRTTPYQCEGWMRTHDALWPYLSEG